MLGLSKTKKKMTDLDELKKKIREETIEEYSNIMMDKLPNNMDYMYSCGEFALLICGVEEYMKNVKETTNE